MGSVVSGWGILGVVVLVVALGSWLLFRSLRKWRLPPPTTPEAQQAEARLWSTMVSDQL